MTGAGGSSTAICPSNQGSGPVSSKTLQADEALRRDLHDTLDRWFFRYRSTWPSEARRTRNELIGRLRRLLAGICLEVLEPDLIVLDEFQRFKPLLETQSRPPERGGPSSTGVVPGSPLMTGALCAPCSFQPRRTNSTRPTPRSTRRTITRTSWPPQTFLFGDGTERIDTLSEGPRAICAFAQASRFARFCARGPETPCGLPELRSPTWSISSGRSWPAPSGLWRALTGMRWLPHPVFRLRFALRTCASTLRPTPSSKRWATATRCHSGNPLRTWPTSCAATRSTSASTARSRTRRKRCGRCFGGMVRRSWTKGALGTWSAIDPANGKLREMATSHLDRDGLWRLLWLPPTVPYWPLEGAYANAAGATKSLMFSAWNVVPDVVSGVLSYEAERRMAGGRIGRYENPDAQQRPLLRFTQPADRRRSRHRLLLLLLPCVRLADDAHPLGAPSGTDRHRWVRERVTALLSGLPDPPDGRIDDRWEWAIPLLLDPGLRAIPGAVEKGCADWFVGLGSPRQAESGCSSTLIWTTCLEVNADRLGAPSSSPCRAGHRDRARLARRARDACSSVRFPVS